MMKNSFWYTTVFSLVLPFCLLTSSLVQDFDAVLTDPAVPTGSLLARKLREFSHRDRLCVFQGVLSSLTADSLSGLPTINLLRGMPCFLDMRVTGCPSPPSYVPRFFTGYIDKMSFRERLVNTVVSNCGKKVNHSTELLRVCVDILLFSIFKVL